MDSQHNLVLDVNIWSCPNLWAHWDEVVGTSAQVCLTNLWSERLKVNALFEVHNSTGTWNCRATDLESLFCTRTDRDTHRGEHWIPLMNLIMWEESRVQVTCYHRECECAHIVPAALGPTVLVWLRHLQTTQSTSCPARSTRFRRFGQAWETQNYSKWAVMENIYIFLLK